MARNVVASIPPNTPVLMEFRLAAPAPVATTSGNTPRMKATDVMIIGRKRRCAVFECRILQRLACGVNADLQTPRSGGVFGSQPDQRNQSNLEINVVGQSPNPDGQQRSQYSKGHREA